MHIYTLLFCTFTIFFLGFFIPSFIIFLHVFLYMWTCSCTQQFLACCEEFFENSTFFCELCCTLHTFNIPFMDIFVHFTIFSRVSAITHSFVNFPVDFRCSPHCFSPKFYLPLACLVFTKITLRVIYSISRKITIMNEFQNVLKFWVFF